MKYFVYLLQSLKDKKYYIGQTDDISKRLKAHNQGMVKSTKNRVPFRLVNCEEYPTQKEARWRERNLKKSAWQRNKFIQKFIYVALLTFLIFPPHVFASSTDGTIDSAYKYAWGENISWFNFGTAEGNVHITDSALTGYAWGENIGWISLNCSNDSSCGTVDYKVANDGEGILTGYAWSENTGWINFNPTYGGVTINSSGEFLGYAWGENIGWIVFNCSTANSCGTVDYKVKTDWRPRSARTTSASAVANAGLPISILSPPVKTALPISSPNINNPVSANIPVSQYQSVSFTKYLYPGLFSPDVKNLQSLLSNYPDIYPEQKITGYYGPLTKQAIQRLQIKYNITNQSDNAFGLVGPKTRKILNLLEQINYLQNQLNQILIQLKNPSL